MKIFTLYVVIIFISTCLSDIRITRRCESPVIFLFSVFRIGWPSCLFTSPCSLNTAQSIFQTLSHQEPGTITLSAGSVLLISCYTSTLTKFHINLFNVCLFIYLGHFFYQSVQECPKCICISESHFQWGRPGSNAQLHNRLG